MAQAAVPAMVDQRGHGGVADRAEQAAAADAQAGHAQRGAADRAALNGIEHDFSGWLRLG